MLNIKRTDMNPAVQDLLFDPTRLAAGFQAVYGDYRGLNQGLLSLNAARRRILTGEWKLDPVWLRLAKEIIKQLDRPLEIHVPNDHTEEAMPDRATLTPNRQQRSVVA